MDAFAEFADLRSAVRLIEGIDRNVDQLMAARARAWDDIIRRAAALYAAGEITLPQLGPLLADVRATYGSGYTRIWDAYMPITATRLPWVLREAGYAAQPPGRVG
jgi:hypothetical protein